MRLRLFSSLLLLIAFFAQTHAAEKPAISDFSSLESLPVQDRQRQRPFYTFAIETMQSLTGRATYKAEKPTLNASQALFSIWTRPDQWREKPLIFINYAPLRIRLGLEEKRSLFSLNELSANSEFRAALTEVERINADTNPDKPPLDRYQTEMRDVSDRLRLAEKLLSGAAFAFVPAARADQGGLASLWVAPEQAPILFPGVSGDAVAKTAEALKDAYRNGDQAAFSLASIAFSDALKNLPATGYVHISPIMKLETFFQKLHPFQWAAVLYGIAGIILALTTLSGRQTGYRLAWAAVLTGFALHIFGFTARILIGGRAPVTNMYESVVWVAFGAVFFAILMEAKYRSRIILLAAMPLAVIFLILSDIVPTVLNPSINPLQPVLDNNFWLSTHVTTITAAYAAFVLALGVGHIILFKVFANKPVSPALYNYLYRAMQIGVLLLAIGTILGAIWANRSWGRFWDWDPKETWALIALLGYIALLHGRFAGWWKGFGLAIGSIIGFQTVVMAWYGVNYVLGAGLHSYGFGVGGVQYVAAYVALELLLCAIAIVVYQRRRKQGAAPADEEEEALLTEP